MISVDWTLAVSALIFLITLAGLNRLLFRPIFAAVEERKSKTTDVFESAGASEDRCEALLNQLQEKLKAERQEGYRLAEEVRDQTHKERQKKIAEARESAQQLLDQEKGKIRQEFDEARRKLRGEAEEIAALISRRLVGGGPGV